MENGKVEWTVLTVVLATVLMASGLAGCLGDGGDVKVSLVQTGSSTVLPLAEAWAQEFDGADIAVSGGGSSHGIKELLEKRADLGDASRLLKGSDYEAVGGDKGLVMSDGTVTGPAPSGVRPEKWVVAYDVLVVVVNKDNTWAPSLNYTQLLRIFTNASPAVYWDEVHGLTGAPHEKISIYAPDEASGTYDYFFESIIKDWGKPTQVAKTRLEHGDGVYHPSADDNVILNAIRSEKHAVGFFGLAYFIENPGAVKAVAISKTGSAGVEPSFANVASYPMARPLHIYTDSIPSTGSEKGRAISEYLRFILGEEGQALVPQVGYVRLSLVNATIVTTQLEKLGS